MKRKRCSILRLIKEFRLIPPPPFAKQRHYKLHKHALNKKRRIAVLHPTDPTPHVDNSS